MKALHDYVGSVISDSSDPDLSTSARSFLNAMPGMAYRRINDGRWSLVYVSNGCRELLGLDPEEVIASGMNGYESYIHPSHQEFFLEASRLMDVEKIPFSLAYVVCHHRGWDRWVHDTGVGVFDDKGKLLYVDGFVTDCAGHKLIQARMRQQRGEFLDYFSKDRFGDIIGKSPAMQSVFGTIFQAAQTDDCVIIYGESGTGKELAVREVHRVSDRWAKPFIPVNCGAIPENLMESELFGYRKGAFSGADRDKQGLLEAAHGGTLFLDEVGEIPLSMQVKLLRALEGDGFTPMGGCEVIKPDLRVVAATNRDLSEMVRAGRIRSDFFYRINVIPVHIPPLRERREDIPILVGHFLGDSKQDKFLPGRSLKAILDYDWPGNVRELKNQIRQYVTLGHMDIDQFVAVGDEDGGSSSRLEFSGHTLKEHMARCEADAIAAALFKHQWNRTAVAKALGIDRRTLFSKIKRYGLDTGDTS